jgi:hypothetical protein
VAKVFWKRGLAAAALLGALLGVACAKDTTGVEDVESQPLDAADRAALVNAMLNSGALGDLSELSTLILANVTRVGTMNVSQSGSAAFGRTLGTRDATAPAATYSAAGLKLSLDITSGAQRIRTTLYGVLGWVGTASNLSEVVVTLGAGASEPVTITLDPQQFSGTEGASGGTAILANAPFSASTVYVATSGSLRIDRTAFAGSASWGPTFGLSGTVSPIGAMRGNVNFQASNTAGGTRTVTADFSLQERRTGKVLIERQGVGVSGTYLLSRGETEATARARALSDLAERIVSMILYAW